MAITTIKIDRTPKAKKTNSDLAKEQIKKLEEKLVRINEALTTGKNPYYYHESDIKRTTSDLEAAKARLAKYEAKEQLEAQLEAGKVEIIEKFLDEWEARVNEYYRRKVEQYIEYTTVTNPYPKGMSRQECDKAYRAREKEIDLRFSKQVIRYGKGYANYEKDTAADKKAKREMFYARIAEITGAIKDAKYLTIGDNGEINGIVYGDKGTVSVETISAGGWNIQCFHFRVLVRDLNK